MTEEFERIPDRTRDECGAEVEPLPQKLTKVQRDGLLGATDAIGRMIADEMAPPEGCDAWEYRDLPWMGREPWNLVMATIGHGQFRMIAMSERRGPPGERRGQFWISPEACFALRELAERPIH